MVHEQYTLIFNGEIYNYKEIREELQQSGYLFETKSDTEVLLKSYIHWGESCVEKFNGMWAFCIFDALEEKCFFSRDRIGVKPLYYYQDEHHFYFTSEIKALLEFGVERIGNKKEIIKYLIYGNQEHQDETMFQNIFRFPAGHNGVYSFKNRELTLSSFFELKSSTTQKVSEEEAIQSIQESIDKSVLLRMRSDVPIGMALSGGVDSNIVVSLVSQQDSNIETFSSIYTENKNINETDNINVTVNRLGLQSNFTTVTKDTLLQDIEKVVWYQDEPFDTLGIVAQNRVYDLMHRKNIKVSLDGQGADEVFGGYPTYKSIYLRENLFNVKAYKKILECGFINIQNIKLVILSFFPSLFEKMYFQKRVKKTFSKSVNFISSDKKGFTSFKNLNQKLQFDTSEYLRVLLRYVDRNSMQFSVESRGIFLDYKVVESGLKIPSELKVKECYSKYILRKSYDSLVNKKVLWDKKKLGFPVPQNEWMKDKEVIEVFNQYLANSKIIKTLEISKESRLDSDIFWKVVNIAIWEKVFSIEGVQ